MKLQRRSAEPFSVCPAAANPSRTNQFRWKTRRNGEGERRKEEKEKERESAIWRFLAKRRSERERALSFNFLWSQFWTRDVDGDSTDSDSSNLWKKTSPEIKQFWEKKNDNNCEEIWSNNLGRIDCASTRKVETKNIAPKTFIPDEQKVSKLETKKKFAKIFSWESWILTVRSTRQKRKYLKRCY